MGRSVQAPLQKKLGLDYEALVLLAQVPTAPNMGYGNPKGEGWEPWAQIMGTPEFLLLPFSHPPTPYRNGSLTGHQDRATSASPAAPLPNFPPHTCRQEREPTLLGSNVCSCACRDKNN